MIKRVPGSGWHGTRNLHFDWRGGGKSFFRACNTHTLETPAEEVNYWGSTRILKINSQSLLDELTGSLWVSLREGEMGICSGRTSLVIGSPSVTDWKGSSDWRGGLAGWLTGYLFQRLSCRLTAQPPVTFQESLNLIGTDGPLFVPFDPQNEPTHPQRDSDFKSIGTCSRLTILRCS